MLRVLATDAIAAIKSHESDRPQSIVVIISVTLPLLFQSAARLIGKKSSLAAFHAFLCHFDEAWPVVVGSWFATTMDASRQRIRASTLSSPGAPERGRAGVNRSHRAAAIDYSVSATTPQCLQELLTRIKHDTASSAVREASVNCASQHDGSGSAATASVQQVGSTVDAQSMTSVTVQCSANRSPLAVWFTRTDCIVDQPLQHCW